MFADSQTIALRAAKAKALRAPNPNKVLTVHARAPRALENHDNDKSLLIHLRHQLGELLQKKQLLLAQGTKPGWITAYPVERRNKNGKTRTYTYFHYCFWDPEGKHVRKTHIPRKQLVHYQEECNRNQEVKHIHKQIQRIQQQIQLEKSSLPHSPSPK